MNARASDIHLPMIIDSFAGGGGASTGIELALGRSPDVAINHNPDALALHAANHPGTLHLDSNIWDVEPRAVTKGRPVGLLWASPDCFPAGTMILTDRGYRPIEEIAEGDHVLTHSGRYRRVYATMRTVRPVRTIDIQGVPSITVSSEHPFYARRMTNVWDNQSRRYARTLEAAAWVRAKDLRTGPAPMNAAGGDRHFCASPCSFEELPIPQVGGRGISIDERLMWLAGRYVGDGWTRLTEDRAELVITCSKVKADELAKSLDVWPRTGQRSSANELAWHRRDTGTAHQFTTSHRGLVDWLRAEFGHGGERKSFPAWALSASEQMRMALLAGYVSADGSTLHRKAGALIETITISKALALSTKALVESLGYTATVSQPRANSSEIEGRTVDAKPTYLVRWRDNPQRLQTMRDGLHNWSRVQAVSEEIETKELFNISVEEDETYVADGIVVHNCKHFSKAKGGAPKDRNIRDLAWVVVRWAEDVKPDVICMENVEEFQTWGPIDNDGQPIKEFAGQTYELWLKRLRKAGYKVQWRELRACDYGAPTIRNRYFLIARRDGRPIRWPKPTHGDPKSDAVKRGKLKAWRTAAECIDWSIPCPSIFDTSETIKAKLGLNSKRPLADNTLARIARGMKRYVIDADRPFLVNLTHGGRTEDVADPFRTITGAHRGEKAVVAPSITRFNGGSTGCAMDEPMPTVTANSWIKKPGGAAPLGLLAPQLVSVAHGDSGGRREYPVTDPYGVVTAGGISHAVVAPSLLSLKGTDRRDMPVAAPHPTVLAGGGHSALIAPHLATMRNSMKPWQGADEPTHTITAGGAGLTLCAPVLTYAQHGGSTRDPLAPMHTVTASPKDQNAVICPTLVQTGYGEAPGQVPRALDIGAPLGTVVAGGVKHALVATTIVGCGGRAAQSRPRGIDEPAATVTAKADACVASAFLAQHNTGVTGHDLREPVSTITGAGSHQQPVAAFIARHFWASIGHGADEPTGTVTAGGGGKSSPVAAFFAKYYGTGDGARHDDPLHTITTKDRFCHAEAALVAPPFTADHEARAREVADFLRAHGAWDGGEFVTLTIAGATFVVVDIGMRMLTPRELFNAQGFPSDYVIDGVWAGNDFRPFAKDVQVSCCGNSVCPDVARAIIAENCQHLAVASREAAHA